MRDPHPRTDKVSKLWWCENCRSGVVPPGAPPGRARRHRFAGPRLCLWAAGRRDGRSGHQCAMVVTLQSTTLY
eukprot:scaffold31016_cov50-Phaeocystis_antarctica.AAC.3